eukprot:g50852.t1
MIECSKLDEGSVFDFLQAGSSSHPDLFLLSRSASDNILLSAFAFPALADPGGPGSLGDRVSLVDRVSLMDRVSLVNRVSLVDPVYLVDRVSLVDPVYLVHPPAVYVLASALLPACLAHPDPHPQLG